MTLSPQFEIAGWNSNPDASHRLQPKLRSKRSGEKVRRRIMDMDEGIVGDIGTDATLTEATKSLVFVSLPEIPDYLPQTAGSHPTEEERGTWLEQSGKTSGKPFEVVNAVQCSEVRKCSIEQLFWVQRADIFRAKYPRAHKSLQSALPDSASGNVDHLR